MLTVSAAAAEFLDRPGVAGPFGALMDEYARAADDFCRVVESTPLTAFLEQRPSQDPDTRSPQAICLHVCGAARRYADYIRKARGLPFQDRCVHDPSELPAPGAVRDLLRLALRYTEDALLGLYEVDEPTYAAIRFQVRWGPVYDPEMILEHGIVHLLRHRRQLERWGCATPPGAA